MISNNYSVEYVDGLSDAKGKSKPPTSCHHWDDAGEMRDWIDRGGQKHGKLTNYRCEATPLQRRTALWHVEHTRGEYSRTEDLTDYRLG